MSFPMVALGEVLTKSDEWIDLNSNEQYRQVKVRLWGKGVMLREEVSGAQIAASKRLVVHSQQFIVSRIDARNGAFGLIPDSLDGAVVSSDFPVFTINPSMILPKYLEWMSKTHFFVDLCKAASEGTTNRVRLKEDRFLVSKIPLPPLPEQRRIVAHIEELAAKIEEARGLRRRAGEEIEVLIATALSSILKPSYSEKPQLLDDYLVDIKYGTSEKCSDEETGPAVLRMGNIQNGQIRFSQLKYLEPEKIEPDLYLGKGDILFNRTNSAELVGKCGIFESDLKCTFASYLIRVRLDLNRAIPKLVAFYINSPLGRKYITSEIKQQCGQANVNSKKLKNMPIRLPPLPEQRRIVAYLDALQAKVDALRRLQAETGAELDALIPAVLDRAFKGEL